MNDDKPRTALWTGDIPFNDCCDELGAFDTEGPMAVVFNVIPRDKTTPEVVEYLRNQGGLKAWARCVGCHVGTVTAEASRQVALNLMDSVVTKILESLQNQPNGFVIYDLAKTEMFSCIDLWNSVAENAPCVSGKYLYLGLCYSFQQAAETLDNAIQKNFEKRRRVSWYLSALVPLTLGISCLFEDSFRKSYKLVNKQSFPRDIPLTRSAFGGIVLYN